MEQTVMRIDKEEALSVLAALERYREFIESTADTGRMEDAATHFLYRLERIAGKNGWEKTAV